MWWDDGLLCSIVCFTLLHCSTASHFTDSANKRDTDMGPECWCSLPFVSMRGWSCIHDAGWNFVPPRPPNRTNHPTNTAAVPQDRVVALLAWYCQESLREIHIGHRFPDRRGLASSLTYNAIESVVSQCFLLEVLVVVGVQVPEDTIATLAHHCPKLTVLRFERVVSSYQHVIFFCGWDVKFCVGHRIMAPLHLFVC